MKVYLYISALLLAFAGNLYAGDLTLTTYYPAPHGAYDRLQLVPRSDLTSPCNVGTLYVNSSNELQYCRDDGFGGGTWSPASGLWRQSGDDLFPTDSSPDLFLGLGTQSPLDKLHVKGNILAEDRARTGASVRNKGFHLWRDHAFGTELLYTGGRWTTALFARANDADIAFGKYASNATAQNTFTEQMTLDVATGNLGIGLNTPAQKLDVNGNLRLRGQRSRIFTRGDNDTTHVGGIQFLTYNNGLNNVWTPTNQNGNAIDSSITLGGLGFFNNRIVNLYSSGKLGAGVTNPRSKFGIVDTNVTTTTINIGSNVNALHPIGGWSHDHGFYAQGRGYVGVFLDSVGTDGPAAAATGMAMRTQGVDRGIIAASAAGLSLRTYPSNANIDFLPGRSTPTMRVLTNNRVAIAKTSASYTLDVNGGVRGSFWTNSDIRWKENIETIPNALDKVLKLRGVNFNWKKDEFPHMPFDDKKEIGLIAQEVEKIIPEVVSVDDEGYKNVEYHNLVALLIEAVKEQQKEIEALKKKLDNK